MAKGSNTGTWIAIIGVLGGLWLVGTLVGGNAEQGSETGPESRSSPETYRLIHAIGNEEQEVARDLSRSACEALKGDRTAVAEGLGIHSEQLGVGSITCLPESAFEG